MIMKKNSYGESWDLSCEKCESHSKANESQLKKSKSEIENA